MGIVYPKWDEDMVLVSREGNRSYWINRHSVHFASEMASLTFPVDSNYNRDIQRKDEKVTIASAKAKLARAEALAMEAERELALAESEQLRWGWLEELRSGSILKFKRNFGRFQVYEYGAIKITTPQSGRMGHWWVTGPRQAGRSYTDEQLIEEFLEGAIAEGFNITKARKFETAMAGE